jgi:hypothetical protein
MFAKTVNATATTVAATRAASSVALGMVSLQRLEKYPVSNIYVRVEVDCFIRVSEAFEKFICLK